MPTIEEAAHALNTGHRDEARRILMLMLADDLFNVDILLWIAATAETPEERRKWLQRVLEIDPNNPRALSILRPSQSSDAALPQGEPVEIAKPSADGQQPALAEELIQAQESLATSETKRSRALRRYQVLQTAATIVATVTLIGFFMLYAAPAFSTLGQFMFLGGGLCTVIAFILWGRAQGALRQIETQIVQAKVDAMKLVLVSMADRLASSYK